MNQNSNLLGKSLLKLKEMLEKKQISPQELNQYFLKRIKKYNQKLNAFITVCFDKKYFQGNLGLPMAIKDNFCTKGIRTTAASKVLDNFIPPYESTVTQRLLDNKFSIIGKTNMDAWAHGSSTDTSDYGPTRNPWDLERSPGGSSGGSAAAVSAYLSPVAIGSETAGSIRQPAAWSGIIGLKPSYGRVSRYGLIAMASSLDCPGILSLTVEDSAYLLKIIAGVDKYDATTSNKKVDDYPKEITSKRKFTIGVPEEYFEDLDEQIKEKIYQAIDIFQSLGHKIKKISLLHPKYMISVYTILMRSEVSSNLSRYDGIRYGNERTMFAAEAKRRIMLGTYALSYGYYEAYYKKALKVRSLLIEDFKRVYKDVNLIFAPTTPVTALKTFESDKYPFFGELMDVFNEPAAIAGLPAINIPIGLDANQLPIGAQIMGDYFSESLIMNLAYQFEKETDFFAVIKKGINRYKD